MMLGSRWKFLWAHGNWKSQHCSKCKAEYPDDLMNKATRLGEVRYCLENGCGGAVKPDLVFFGQALPVEFEEREKEVLEADLMLVLGTNLKMAPCSRLPLLVKEGVPRDLIKNEQVGDMGRRDEDVCILGSCDDGVRRLADALGWRNELECLWEESISSKKNMEMFDGGPSLDECIENLVSGMKDKLMVSDGHKRMVESHLNDKFSHSMAKKHRI
jgi:NAD-dependent histone deacetylase SIR2